MLRESVVRQLVEEGVDGRKVGKGTTGDVGGGVMLMGW